MTHSPLASRTATREVLDRFGLSAKYALGQNFLVDDNVIGNILQLAGLSNAAGANRSILEIGPGIGTLTVALLEHGHVVSVERDRDLLPVLAETTAFNSDRFAVVEGDCLKVTRGQLEAAFSGLGAPLPSLLVANLPYAVAATVILDWFQRFGFLETMVVMVQSEVADRIAAQQGTKEYGAYTIKLRMHARVAGRFQVSPNCFHPAPHVESAVVRLERVHDTQAPPEVVAAACEVADAAFAQRRKNIRNSMRSRFDAPEVDALLAACGVAPTVRGETLSVEDYLRLGGALVTRRAAE